MRLLLTLVMTSFCMGALVSHAIAAQQTNELDFPFQAIVSAEQASVHSGPDAVHYATEMLPQGATVLVYRFDPGGWCAIRPTPNSFSLVPESTLEIVDENLGRVIESGTQSWVGTRLGSVTQPLWQIKLRKDELVDILGEVSWPHPDGHSTVWYQIDPPDGEFRWIRKKDLLITPPSRSSEPDSGFKQIHTSIDQQNRLESHQTDANPVGSAPVVRRDESGRGLAEGPTRRSTEPLSDSPKPLTSTGSTKKLPNSLASQPLKDTDVRPATLEQADVASNFSNTPEPSASDSGQGGWRVAKRRIKREPPENSNHSFDVPSQVSHRGGLNSDQTDRPARYADARFDSANGEIQRPKLDSVDPLLATAPRLPQLSRIPTGRVGEELKQLDLRLSQEMLREPGDWRLTDLTLTAETLQVAASTDEERLFANRIVAKIERCVALRKKFRNADRASTRREDDASGRQPIGTGVNDQIELGTTYDAYGWLNQLARRSGQAHAEFVLQDADGKITHHIAPSAGLNLHRYLKSRVGIIGPRGFHRGLNLNHVTAERVIVLNK